MGRHDDDHGAREALADFVEDSMLDAYVGLLRKDRWREPEIDELLGPDTVQCLLKEGLACRQGGPDQGAWVVPTPPPLALMAQLVLCGQSTLAAQKRLLDGQRRLADLQRVHYNGAVTSDLVEIITNPDIIRQMSLSLVVAAQEHWMSLDNTEHLRPLEEAQLIPPPLAEGVQSRAIYEKRCLENPVGVKMIRAAIEEGEVARTVPRVPMKMKLVDETAGMLPLDPTGARGAMVVRAPVILHALRDYFELLWATGTPLFDEAPTPELNEAETTVLRLLAEDAGSDETIANRMGIHVRSVRRHIDSLREVLGVDSRFALGAAAVRRGWLN